MRKLLIIIASILCCFGLTTVGCADDEELPTATPARSNVLVAYFSWSSSGNTEKMANYIANKTGATLYEIEPLVPYPTEYTPTTEVAREEKENNARPEIKNPIDVSNYDYIFVGFPIWWHTAPMIIGTFLESYNLEGKEIFPFFQGASNSNDSYYTETMAFINDCVSDGTVHDGLYAAATDTSKIDAYLNAIDFTMDKKVSKTLSADSSLTSRAVSNGTEPRR